MNRKLVIICILGLIIISSACMNSNQPDIENEVNSNEWNSSKWCQENGHGDALLKGCATQEEALALTSDVGGEFYYGGEENPEINCSPEEVYICEE